MSLYRKVTGYHTPLHQTQNTLTKQWYLPFENIIIIIFWTFYEIYFDYIVSHPLSLPRSFLPPYFPNSVFSQIILKDHKTKMTKQPTSKYKTPLKHNNCKSMHIIKFVLVNSSWAWGQLQNMIRIPIVTPV